MSDDIGIFYYNDRGTILPEVSMGGIKLRLPPRKLKQLSREDFRMIGGLIEDMVYEMEYGRPRTITKKTEEGEINTINPEAIDPPSLVELI